MKPVFWPAIAYWLLCGVIPTSLVILLYQHGNLYVALYSHFFLYPFFFGWISVALIQSILPFLTDLLKKWGRVKQFWVGIVIFSVAALGLDLVSENVAPWEVSPGLLEHDSILAKYFETEKHTDDEKLAFQDRMNQAVADLENWSLFRWIYPIVFVGQAFALLTVLFVSGLLAKYRLSAEYDSKKFSSTLTISTAAIIVCLLYSLMRRAFSHQKAYFYPGESNPAADWVILGLFVVALLFSAACFWIWLGEHFVGVVSFVFGGTGILAAWKYTEILASIFGRTVGYVSYLSILVGILAVGYLWYLIKPIPSR